MTNNSTEVVKENKMGTMKVSKLLIEMSLPIVISMLVQAMYNVVDSIFVAHLSENALAAVSLAFPVQNLMIAVGTGTAVGVNALLSKRLGEKKFDLANQTADNGILLSILSALVFLVLGVSLSGFFMSTQTEVSEIRHYGVQYIDVCCIFSFGLMCQMMFERILQSTGRTFYTMITQGTGAIINIILDPILIFGLLGAPKLGVAGAAYATVTGQIIAALLALFFNLKLNKDVKLFTYRLKPDGKTIRRIYSVGLPTILMISIGSVMTYGMNTILSAFSTTAIAVFGIYFKLQSFAFMPVFGLNNGMVPIISYNFGAGRKDRMIETIKLAIIYGCAIMILALIIIQLFPKELLRLFDANEQMIKIGVPALRIISLSFILAGFSVVTCSVFQSLGNGLYSMLVQFIRQLIVLLPVAFLLSKTGNVTMVWWAYPIAEIVSLISCAHFLKTINKNIISRL